MKNKKLSGSFYTPKIVADFLVDYLYDKLKDKSSICVLEPSAGDGIFVISVYNLRALANMC
jgi:adenine-specific DNA-methyltransferase